MRVTKTLLSHWNVSESEVLNAARQNTERLCPGKIMNMLGVISGMLEPSEKELFPDTEKIPHDMYVLTNINQVNGATVMMYDSFLKRLHQKMGTFVLLPSSIHEVIVYPFDKNSMSFYEYQQMVMEINQTCVLEEEVLAFLAKPCSSADYARTGQLLFFRRTDSAIFWQSTVRQGDSIDRL